MLQKTKLLVPITSVFIAVEIALGVLLQTATGGTFAPYAYPAIILACMYCVLYAEKSVSYAATQIALVCTVCADYFLVWSKDMKQLPAMIFFSITQLAYFARLYWEETDASRKKGHLICRVALSAVAIGLTLGVLGAEADALALVSMFYYANLLLNIVYAFVHFRRCPLLAIGLLLFACCDTVIGLGLLDNYLAIPANSILYRIISPGFNLAWAFYLPSQVMLSMSLIRREGR